MKEKENFLVCYVAGRTFKPVLRKINSEGEGLPWLSSG